VVQRATITIKSSLLAVTEANFGRQVLGAPLPVILLFSTPLCRASRALMPLLRELASLHTSGIRVASINAERAQSLTELAGVQMTPTLIVMQAGEILTRVIGFVPPGLLRLLCDQIATGTLPADPLWSPSEATFEDVVVAPLLDAWGFTYVRQAACPAPTRGRIDFLVYDDQSTQPLTLFENKRHIASAQALAQAVTQAHTYARALSLPSFVIAAPAGLWIYACMGRSPLAMRRVTSLELLQQPDSVPRLLRHLNRSMIS